MAEYYKEALKLGQKEIQNCKANGLPTQLPVLDEILPSDKAASAVNLGLVPIPLSHIVGTKTGGRSSAFAPNFMPVLEENSEFGVKWKHLCEAHLNEGIHDPIKAYEYMNRFYVLEGNKRVSVLKYFGADSIEGVVTRIMPERDGSEEVELYYEFVEFYKYTKINFIEFSKRGSYNDLLTVLGKELDEEWTLDDQRTFASAYHKFEKAYLQSGGGKLQSTIGDALLGYIEIYKYDELVSTDISDIKKNLSKMWEEVELKEDEAPIELKTDPPTEKKQGVLARMLSGEPDVLTVGFVYDGTPAKSGWVHEHEEGRLYVQKVFEDKIDTLTYPNALGGDRDPYEVILQAIEDGCNVIFSTSPRLVRPCIRAAVEHPEVIILNCSLNTSHRYILTYYARMYEAKFILGAVAGTLSHSGRLGYVCDYPIYGQIAGINAFALGAQMTNPRAKIYLEWSSVRGSADEAAKYLVEQDIHFISSQDTSKFLEDSRENYGLFYIKDGESDSLIHSVWCWGKYYEEILRRIFDKSLQTEYNKSNKALNYYLGMSAGVIDVWCSEKLPLSTRRFVDFLKESIKKDICIPFLTPFNDQYGELVGEGQKSLTVEQIINMDYLAANVVGDIPRYADLNEMGKATVDTAGIEKSQNDPKQEAEQKAGAEE